MGLNRTWLIAIDSAEAVVSLSELSGQMKRKAAMASSPVPLLRPDPPAQEFLFRLDRLCHCLLLPGAGRREESGVTGAAPFTCLCRSVLA